MEKLKALLVHRFWMLFGVVLLIPIVGWWIASGSLSAQTETATTAITTAKNAVPKEADVPNTSFVEGAEAVVEQKEKLYEQQHQRLWDQQKSLMTWPVGMEAMSEYDFEAPISDADRLQYQLRYNDEVQRIRKLLPEYKATTESGLVVLEGATLPFVDVKAAWGFRSPSSQQTWEAQMDNWFTESIFKAIRQVNGTVEDGEGQTIRDVAVRQVQTLIYKGGRRAGAEPAVAAAEPEAELEGVPGAAPAAFDPFAGGGGVGFGRVGEDRRGALGTSAMGPSPVGFDPASVFGDATLAATTTDGTTEPAPVQPRLGALGANNQGAAAERRYIDDDESLPYRTRGFYLHVVMQNDAVPDLLLALSNMEWPTAIVHVHMAETHPPRLERVVDGGGAFRQPDGGPAGVRLGQRNVGLGGVPGEREGNDGGNQVGLHTAALGEGNGLADVVIAGIITIYNEPAKDEETEASSVETTGESESTEAETPDTGETETPESTGSEQPADGNTTTDEGTEPADPKPADPDATPPAEGADTDETASPETATESEGTSDMPGTDEAGSTSNSGTKSKPGESTP